MVVSATSGLVVAARASVPVSEGEAELGELFGCGIAVILTVGPLTESNTEQVAQTSSHLSCSFFVRSLPLLGLFFQECI